MTKWTVLCFVCQMRILTPSSWCRKQVSTLDKLGLRLPTLSLIWPIYYCFVRCALSIQPYLCCVKYTRTMIQPQGEVGGGRWEGEAWSVMLVESTYSFGPKINFPWPSYMEFRQRAPYTNTRASFGIPVILDRTPSFHSTNLNKTQCCSFPISAFQHESTCTNDFIYKRMLSNRYTEQHFVCWERNGHDDNGQQGAHGSVEHRPQG